MGGRGSSAVAPDTATTAARAPTHSFRCRRRPDASSDPMSAKGTKVIGLAAVRAATSQFTPVKARVNTAVRV